MKMAAGRSVTATAPTGKGGSGAEVGRDLDGGRIDDPDRWEPMTDDEMEAELDLLDAEESIDPSRASSKAAVLDPVEDKIQRANRLRELENAFAARQLLYQVLEEGDESQRRVARNILNQIDEG